MERQPILSILLPNRQSTPYIFKTIENLLRCKDRRFELLINENSIPDFVDYSAFEKDFRVKVYREPSPLSMTKNWYNALGKATGKYVIFIGSDDGCIPENLSILISYLAENSYDAINTRHSFYNYPASESKAFVTLAEKEITMNTYTYAYPKLLSLLFYSYRTWLPLPYALSVVKRDVFVSILEKYNEIPGIAPDDFLSHFVAQKLKSGIYFDLCVFITGTSPRSNGQSLLTQTASENSKQFISDSNSKMGELTTIFGLNCLSSIAIEHFMLARFILTSKKSKVGNLLKLWAIFSCLDKSHHSSKLFKITLSIRKTGITYLERALKFGWKFSQFGLNIPASTKKITDPKITDINQAADFIFAHTKNKTLL
jgi:glycosyltransferase involved in cell wall biosynthesis